MAWTNPRTWVDGEVVNAALLNQQVRDNLETVSPDALSAGYAAIKTAQGGDETAALNAFLAAESPINAKRLVGNFSVSGSLTIPAGLYLDLTAATITQTGVDQTTLAPGAGVTIVGGTLTGKGTDYVATTTPTPKAIGIKVDAANVRVMQTRITRHANAGIYVNASDFNATSVRIDGVAATQAIPSNDAACFGIYINGGTRHSFTDVDIRGVSIGIIGALVCTYIAMTNVRISNVLGQHGVYLQEATGLNVNGLQLSDIAFHGIKVQLYSGSTVDSVGCSIVGVTANTCGDAAVILYNSDTDLTSAKRLRSVTVSNVTASDCSRALFLGSIRGGTVSNIVSRNATGSTIIMIDCQDVLVGNVLSEGSGRMGIHGITGTGAATQRIRFSNIRIKSPAAANVASNVYGVYIDGGTTDWSGITFDGLDITSGNANMVYGFFFAGGEQETLRVRDAVLQGSVTTDVRLAAGPKAVAEWLNVRMANAAAPVNFPATALPSGGTGLTNEYFNNAIPTAGTYRLGDRVWNNAPAASGTIGWVCTAAGTPGTWKTFGAIGA